MNPTVALLIRQEFARRAEDEREWIKRGLQAARERMRDEPAKEKQKREEAEFRALMQSITMATAPQIADFSHKLDRYDAATVQTLMDNDKALAEVRERINGMLLKAHVLPDGRRVFRTEDGTQVFDEHGVELSKDIIDPDEIGRERPSWDSFKRDRMTEVVLVEERKQLLDYQQKLDRARDRLGEEGLTTQELDDLGKDLESDMPASIRGVLNTDPAAKGASADRQLAMDRDDLTPVELPRDARERTAQPAPMMVP